MKAALPILVAIVAIVLGCNTQQGIFAKRTPLEQYKNDLEDAGLVHTTVGNLWIGAGGRSLNSPASIVLPFEEKGFIPVDKPYAAGYRFSVKRGEKISVRISAIPATVKIFSELYELESSGGRKLVHAADTSERQFSHESKRDASYLFRMQPELLEAVQFTLTIVTEPSLGYPVRRQDNPRLISVWGVDRDGGRRSHEGIDIAAAKRTPAVAAADGVITRVNENELGGKVVFMRPKGRSYSLYYAHLDSQIVRSGDNVKEGEIIGLIGNTGNARGTIPHLHFGIYTSEGAVDPLPFVEQNRPRPKKIVADTTILGEYVRLNTNEVKLSNATTIKYNGEPLIVVGANADEYKLIFPSGSETFISSNRIIKSPVNTITLSDETNLLDRPEPLSPAIQVLEKGKKVSVIGSVQDFHLVRTDNLLGWIPR